MFLVILSVELTSFISLRLQALGSKMSWRQFEFGLRMWLSWCDLARVLHPLVPKTARSPLKQQFYIESLEPSVESSPQSENVQQSTTRSIFQTSRLEELLHESLHLGHLVSQFPCQVRKLRLHLLHLLITQIETRVNPSWISVLRTTRMIDRCRCILWRLELLLIIRTSLVRTSIPSEATTIAESTHHSFLIPPTTLNTPVFPLHPSHPPVMPLTYERQDPDFKFCDQFTSRNDSAHR